jgi:hypothetical protein
MRHANGVSPRMRSWLHRFLTSLCVMALLALGAIAAVVPFAAMSDAASPAIAASEAPLPTNAAADPAVVVSQSACTDLATCVAVGSFEDSNGVQQSLIETYSSGAWSASEGALPTNADATRGASLGAVSCPASGSCVAIGSYFDRDGNQQAFVDTLAQGAWSPVVASLPPNAAANPDAQLHGISCTTTNSCVAVGTYQANGAAVERPALIEILAGSTWTPLEAPLPPGAGSGDLNAVSCPADGSCVAVGTYNVMRDTSGLIIEDTLPLVETLTSATWAPSEGAIPAAADTAALDAESVQFLGDFCDPTGLCQAVGTYADSGGNQLPLVETRSGGTWMAGRSVLPSDAQGNGTFAAILAVSCPPGEHCVAVGNYLDGNGNQRALVESLSTGSWAPSEAPLPSGTTVDPSASLNGVSCSISAVGAAPTAAPTATSTPPPSTTTSTTTSSGPTPTTGSTSTSTTTRTPTSSATTSTPTSTTTTTTTTTTSTTTPTPAASPMTTSCTIVGSYQDASGLTQGVLGTETPGQGTN